MIPCMPQNVESCNMHAPRLPASSMVVCIRHGQNTNTQGLHNGDIASTVGC